MSVCDKTKDVNKRTSSSNWNVPDSEFLLWSRTCVMISQLIYYAPSLFVSCRKPAAQENKENSDPGPSDQPCKEQPQLFTLGCLKFLEEFTNETQQQRRQRKSILRKRKQQQVELRLLQWQYPNVPFQQLQQQQNARNLFRNIMIVLKQSTSFLQSLPYKELKLDLKDIKKLGKLMKKTKKDIAWFKEFEKNELGK